MKNKLLFISILISLFLLTGCSLPVLNTKVEDKNIQKDSEDKMEIETDNEAAEDNKQNDEIEKVDTTVESTNDDSSNSTLIETPVDPSAEKNISGLTPKDRDNQRKARVTDIAAAVETYLIEQYRYPIASSDVCVQMDNQFSYDIASMVEYYMNGIIISVDGESECIYYRELENGYMIYANLETNSGNYDRALLKTTKSVTNLGVSAHKVSNSDLYAYVRIK